MRPMAISALEVTTRRNLMGNQSLVPAVKELWNLWEIHCLILISLSLQVFLFLFAGMRRRSSSSILSTVLWLAYLSADSVAIFVLGHLAVRASEPNHQLMSFWAPFVLVHLGGQDTITAFSKQDNELWMRHLLSLVTQVALAGYVVAKASWSDRRLKAAMVIMFLSGFFKYVERTLCLYLASPAGLRSSSMDSLKSVLQGLREEDDYRKKSEKDLEYMRETLDMMSKGSIRKDDDHDIVNDIMSADAPLIIAESIEVADELPGMLKEFLSGADRYRAYDHVGARLVRCYQRLYTKTPLRVVFWETFPSNLILFLLCPCDICCCGEDWFDTIGLMFTTFFFLWYLFQYVSAPIALALFWAAEKGGQDQLHTSKADITLSYVLLVGAIVLDVSSSTMYFFNITLKGCRIRNAILRIGNRIQPAWSRKQWSEQLAQYSMIKRHIRQDTAGMASIQQWIGRHLGEWGVGLLDLTHTPITRDHTLIKEFILDSLLAFGVRKEWNITSSRGRRAIQGWMDKHKIPDSERPRRALVKTISHDVDFPTSVLIWHNATEICYHCSEDGGDTSNNSHQQLKKHKQLSRELSNYIMYLVFKCGVMLTTNSQLVHDRAHGEIASVLSDAHLGGEKAAVMKLFEPKGEMKDSTGLTDETKTQEELTDEQQDLIHDQQDSTMSEIQKHQELADNDSASGSHHIKKLRQSAQALKSPVLPRAREVAKELISINCATDRWSLIADVWAEMLFFTAPRCGAAFHYEHLSTGGEFITHVLLLMKFLGPFLPPPGA